MPLLEGALAAIGLVLALIIGWKLFKHVLGAIVFGIVLLLILWFTGLINYIF